MCEAEAAGNSRPDHHACRKIARPTTGCPFNEAPFEEILNALV
jgi:hypothetical protein